MNLIKNAMEAMCEAKRGDRIIIRAKTDSEDPKLARIEFEDNGPGIPPDVIPKIFMQGFSTKVKKEDSIGAAGQGQGLFVCKHIIESIHKGVLAVKSEIGTGTTFIMKIPLEEVKEEGPGVLG